MVCFYLRVTQNRNVILLLKLKDVPGVLDGDQLLSEVDSSAELCEVRQVMQSGNCAPARRLKLYWWIVNIIKPFFTKPILNNQLEHDSLPLFRHGIT